MARIVVSYIPALHQGYINFLVKYPGDLLVLGQELVHESPRLDRDIRAMDPKGVATMIQSLELMKSVQVLDDPKSLKALIDSDFILPDEDVNRRFAERYLSKAKVALVPVFLRWDMPASLSKQVVDPKRKVSVEKLDRDLIALAQQEVHKSPDWWRQVGSALVIKSVPPLVAHNRPPLAGDYTFGAFGDPRSNFDAGQSFELSKILHSETAVIAEAAKRGLATKGASMYVTTFPCPVCAKLIAAAGISKVYYQTGYSLLDAEDVLAAARVELIQVETKTPRPH
ncbi:MAG TPA: deaminase [Candidatus Saccharimonadales bacterium]|nr:deaminase [Candidatus Saccharimonadales bacterium]